MKPIPKSFFVFALWAAALLVGQAAAQKPVTFTIGYQKGSLTALLKARGTLERAKAQGITYNWVLFTSGPPLLEALNAGAVDFGSVGDTPGVFALAGGADLKFVAVSESKNEAANTSEALIVKADSPIKTVADLKGKKIGLARGSSAHYFTYKALKEAGLDITHDVEIVPLQPPDARPAIESGSIDAWAIWEPFLSIALASGQFRVLRDRTGLGRSNGYHLTSAKVIRDPDKVRALRLLLSAIAETAAWANANVPTVIDLLSQELGIPKEVLSKTVPKGIPYNIRAFTLADLAPLQKLADAFYEGKVLPRPLELKRSDFFPLPAIGSATSP